MKKTRNKGLSSDTEDSNTPKVSVIMAAFNCADFIGDAINSVLQQSFSDFELLIADDASEDNTAEVIRKIQDPRIQLFSNPENLGYLKTTNLLLKQCKGKYIAFQDADDWSQKTRLKEQLAILDNEKNIDMCGSYCDRFYSNDLQITVKYPLTNTSINRQLEQGRTSLFCGASIMFHRKILTTIGSYREAFDRIGSEDIDWYIRVLEKHGVCNIPIPLYCYRQHEKSISKTNLKKSLKLISADIALSFHLLRKESYLELLNQEEIKIRCNPLIKTTTGFEEKIIHTLTHQDKNSKNNFSLIKNKVRTFILSILYSERIMLWAARKRKVRSMNLKNKLKTNNNPLVSVYIPTHNRAQMLKIAVESVINQTYKNIEIIIVNDGSKDNTDKVVKDLKSAYRNIKYSSYKTPLGACHARNEAIKMARGKYVTGLDDDDLFLPERIEELVNAANNKYSIISSSVIERNAYGEFLAPVKKRHISLSDMKTKNYVGGPTFIERKKLIEAGCFDSTMPAWQDFDLWFRVIEKFGPALRLSSCTYVVNFDREGDRITTRDKHGKGYDSFIKKHGYKLTNSEKKQLKVNDYKNRNKIITIKDVLETIPSLRGSLALASLYLRQKSPFIEKTGYLLFSRKR